MKNETVRGCGGVEMMDGENDKGAMRGRAILGVKANVVVVVFETKNLEKQVGDLSREFLGASRGRHANRIRQNNKGVKKVALSFNV